MHCHHSWRITFCSDSKTNTQSELLHSLDKIETKKNKSSKMNLSIVPYGKYICVWLWLPTVMLLVARMLWRAKMSELYILKGRRDWELLFRAFIDYSLLKWTVPKILMFASFYWYATQRSIGVFDFKPPPRLSLRLPLLFLMDNPILGSLCSDFVVWK